MTCSVYLIKLEAETGEDFEIFKVGISTCPLTRLTAIKTGCPWPVKLVRTWQFSDSSVAREIEQSFHKESSYCRLQGEWFQSAINGAICSIESIILDYWVSRFGLTGALPFLKSVGLRDDYASNIILSEYAAEGLQ